MSHLSSNMHEEVGSKKKVHGAASYSYHAVFLSRRAALSEKIFLFRLLSSQILVYFVSVIL